MKKGRLSYFSPEATNLRKLFLEDFKEVALLIEHCFSYQKGNLSF